MRFVAWLLVIVAALMAVKAAKAQSFAELDSDAAVSAEMVDSLESEAEHTDRHEVMLGTTQLTHNQAAVAADVEAEAQAEAEAEVNTELEAEQEQEAENENEAEQEEGDFGDYSSYVELGGPRYLKLAGQYKPKGVLFANDYPVFNAPFGTERLPVPTARRFAPLIRYVPNGFRGLDYLSELYQFDTAGPLKAPPVRAKHLLVLGAGAPPVKMQDEVSANAFTKKINEMQAAFALGGDQGVRARLAAQEGLNIDDLQYRSLPRNFASKLLFADRESNPLTQFPVEAHSRAPLSAYGGALEVDAEDPASYQFDGTAYPNNLQNLPAAFGSQYGYHRAGARPRI